MNLVVCLEAIEIIELLENQDERRKIRWPMRGSLAPQVHCSIEASDGLLSSEANPAGSPGTDSIWHRTLRTLRNTSSTRRFNAILGYCRIVGQKETENTNYIKLQKDEKAVVLECD